MLQMINKIDQKKINASNKHIDSYKKTRINENLFQNKKRRKISMSIDLQIYMEFVRIKSFFPFLYNLFCATKK